MRVAINQPYYYPYAGWFRFFAASDLFVALDDVQFNRRGRVHRREVTKGVWDTLPIKKTDRDSTRIMDLQWKDAGGFAISPVDFIIGTIGRICHDLNLPFNCVRSSRMMGIDESLRGQDRIIAICKRFEATEYINSPGGRDLYDERTFQDNDIKLIFLPEYKGSYDSMLERVQTENPQDIRQEIMENL